MTKKADNSGFVYVMMKECSPGYFKVGSTAKKPQLRAVELDSTDSPTQSVLLYYVYCLDMRLEKSAHKLLANKRVRPNREWFLCTQSEAIDAIRNAADSTSVSIRHEWHIDDGYIEEENEHIEELEEYSADTSAPDPNALTPTFERITRLLEGAVYQYQQKSRHMKNAFDELNKRELRGENVSSDKQHAHYNYGLSLRLVRESADIRKIRNETLALARTMWGYVGDQGILKLEVTIMESCDGPPADTSKLRKEIARLQAMPSPRWKAGNELLDQHLERFRKKVSLPWR